MLEQIKILSKLQLRNLFGWNVFLHTKDKKEKQRTLLLAFAYLFLFILMEGYLGATAFGYVYIGMGEILPAYFIMISSLIILFFSILKAGSVLFQKHSYEILCSFPIRQSELVISRFICMYIENLLLAMAVMLPGIVIYGVMLKPAVSFYLLGLFVTIFIPLLPLTAASFLGGIVTAIASRMKHKSLVSAFLSILMVVGVLSMTPQMAMLEDNFSIEMLKNLSELIFEMIQRIYPPARLLGNLMTGDRILEGIACIVVSVAAFLAMIIVISSRFHSICRNLYSTTAKHDYKMQSLKQSSVLVTLYKREVKRYFSSSIYVTNTIIGPILAVVFAGSLLGVGLENIQKMLGLPFDIQEIIPFLIAGIFCVMTTTCTSVSMEGKEWWIVKSLPITTKEILDSKLLLGISLAFPSYLIAEILLILALKPAFLELFWLLIIPMVCILFSNVFGITMNLKMPVFQWENEVVIVKQSASAALGGLGGMVIVLLGMLPMFFVPIEYRDIAKGMVCVLFVGLTGILYKKNNKIHLEKL